MNEAEAGRGKVPGGRAEQTLGDPSQFLLPRTHMFEEQWVGLVREFIERVEE